MTIVRRHLDANVIGPQQLAESLRNQRYILETFCQEPLCWTPGTLTAPESASLTTLAVFTGRYVLEYTTIGLATDASLPVMASEGGYNWVTQTATLAAGLEINFGGAKAGHPRNFIPTNEDWFARILLITEDASGTDVFFGFRKVAAYALTLTEYSDVAGIRLLGDSSSTTAAVTLITNLNNAGSTDYTATAAASATPLEDATAIELEVRSVGGKAFYYINNIQQADIAYTFDSGDIMAPVCRLIQSTDISDQLKTLCYEAGPLADRTDATLLSLAGATS